MLSAINKEVYIELRNDVKVQSMKQYKQHGTISTYDHSLNVLNVGYALAKKFKCNDIEIRNVIVGSILHDFYLYDWHDGRIRKEGIHGFSHPKRALFNANCRFNLNKRQKNIISSHMFPMTIFNIPRYKEAWVVTMADKYCAIMEYWYAHVLHKSIFIRVKDLM